MFRILFFLLLTLNCFVVCNAQNIINGTVTDTFDNTLYGVSVYIDGTSIGTTTNSKGCFELKLDQVINSNLVISFVGYQTQYFKISSKEVSLDIRLEETTTELQELVLTNNRFTRKEMMRVFIDKFIGKTKSAKKCTIRNEDVIYFRYNESNNKLFAYADEPLVIINEYLQYEIRYNLVNFEIDFSKLSIKLDDVIREFYAGTSAFKELSTDKKYHNRRQAIFEGSSLELFRNMAQDKWDSKHFLLFDGPYNTVPNQHFTITKLENGFTKVKIAKMNKALLNKETTAQFNLLYNKRQQSKIIFNTSEFLIDNYGLYSNFEQIIFSGAISIQKVGDLLPSNFNL